MAIIAEHKRILVDLHTSFKTVDATFLASCVALALQARRTSGSNEEAATVRAISRKLRRIQPLLPQTPEHATLDFEEVQANQGLDVLMQVFPDVDVAYLRKVLSNTPYLSVSHAADIILNEEQSLPTRTGKNIRPTPAERLHSESYKRACYERLQREFPMLFKSSIKGVLAEHGFDYVGSYLTLREVEARFRGQLMGRFMQMIGYQSYTKAPAKAETTVQDVLRADVERLQVALRKEVEQQDGLLATTVNEQQYREENQTIECSCCYNDLPFESMVACSDGHLFCFDCISKQVNSILYASTTFEAMTCFASVSCKQPFPFEHLERCLSKEVYQLYLIKLQKKEAMASGLRLIECPFCDFVAFSDQGAPKPKLGKEYQQTVRNRRLIADVILLLFAVLGFIVAPGIVSALEWCLLVYVVSEYVLPFFIRQVASQNIPEEFQCENVLCGRLSCRLCSKSRHAPLTCEEAEQSALTEESLVNWDSMRKRVEQAMVMALVRTCPQCNLQFYKSEGCNKMTCQCKYEMCYLCRQDVRQEHYGHFCQHVRFPPGSACKMCNKCELFQNENENEVVKAAGLKAKEDYIRRHPQMRRYANKPIGSLK